MKKDIPSRIDLTHNLPDIIESSENITQEDLEQFRNSEYFQKYVLPSRKRQEIGKKKKRIDWLKNNWIAIAALLVSIIALLKTS